MSPVNAGRVRGMSPVEWLEYYYPNRRTYPGVTTVRPMIQIVQDHEVSNTHNNYCSICGNDPIVIEVSDDIS